MKGPTRPAPSVPGVNRYSPVTNWNDDPFGADLFEPAPCTQKKMPPPRPPPPKIYNKQPDAPVKPSYFVRKPTVLSSLLSRKKNATTNQSNYANHSNALLTDFSSDVDTTKVFPKCEPKNLQTGTLIDFSSPPSSPTFTTRSSSDGLSVDSFGSDATTSTNHHNPNNGNASQAESGFEDDFDLFLNSRKNIPKDDTFDDFTIIDPFSPQPIVNKPPIKKKPIFNKDLFEMQGTNQPIMMKGPTIIRAKPARPKPPENSALLKNTFGSSFSVTNNNMTINTTTPIKKISNGFGDNFDSMPLSWDSSPERESSPPMPSVPPPPPPPVVDEDLPLQWPEDVPDFVREPSIASEDEEKPYAIALFDYFTDHPDDLCFSANAKINLIRRVDNEWLYGSTRGGAEGLFPASYAEVRVPLRAERAPPRGVGAASVPSESAPPRGLGAASALYDFEPAQPGDLAFRAGDKIALLQKLSDEWYFGECNGVKGQFPVNYVQFS